MRLAFLLLGFTQLCSEISLSGSDFVCRNGTKIAISKFCDGQEDCDGSDEILGNASCPLCHQNHISCTISPLKKTCLLHRDYFCNGTVTCQGVTPCDVGCPSHYKCQHSSKCVPRSTVCDGNFRNGCPEDDEWETGVGFQCVRNGKFCRLPQQLLWDSVQDCDDGVDLCYYTNVTVTRENVSSPHKSGNFDYQKCHVCLDETMIIPRHKVCDGTIDCADMSDECLCESSTADVCDHVQLRTIQKSLDLCPTIGQVHCGTSGSQRCVNRSQICDGVADCPDNMDEKFDYCKGTLPCRDGRAQNALTTCRCIGDASTRQTATLCDGKGDCTLAPPGVWAEPPGYPDDECRATCPNSTTIQRFNCTVPFYYNVGEPPFVGNCQSYITYPNGTVATRTTTYDNSNSCDGFLDCTADGKDEEVCVSSNVPPHCCKGRFLCKSGEKISILKSQLCDGRVDCDDGIDEDPRRCHDRFRCPSLRGTKVSVPNSSVCDFINNCDGKEDEMGCFGDGRFYCSSGQPLFIRKHQIMDGRGDCSDWSDECSNVNTAFALSSPDTLIADPFLKVLLFIMGILALLGNLAVIIGEVKQVRQCNPTTGEVAAVRANRLLVLNLAIADFLMGVYLFMLAVASLSYRATYCSKALSWLTSNACIAMGVLVVLSSETSVLTMTFLSVVRTLSVYYPVGSITKPSLRSVIAMITLTWALSFTLALIPLSSCLQSIFVERALIESNPYFSNVVVHFDAAKNFTIKLLSYSVDFASKPDTVLRDVIDAKSWDELHTILPLSYDNYILVTTYFGYYSANSVCIPNFFVTRKDWSWKFSLSITILNLLLFVYSAITFFALLKRAESTSVDSPQGSKKLRRLQLKIIRLIVTDFCCWIPLSIMVFVNFSGVKIDSVSYAVAAIVLLPINSALNPILYSNFVDKIVEKCRGKTPASVPSSRVTSTSLSSQNTSKMRMTQRKTDSSVSGSREFDTK